MTKPQKSKALTRVRMLRVTRCTDASLWYASRVGDLVPCLGFSYGQWTSREPEGYANFIDEENARVVHVFVSPKELNEYPYKFRTPIDRSVPTPHRWPPPPPAGPPTRIWPDCAKQTKATGQSQSHSFAEATTNIVVGFGVSVALTALLMPAFGHHVTLPQNIALTSVFTIASFIRAYGLRRLFNQLSTRATP